MAKQSGLHQIKGKVGEYSYYNQTGVSGGLIRSINQGLSARVKTGAEYANTRLNNQEFAAACNVAGVLGKLVVPKFRPMILPMSQSKMAKEILNVAREHPASWGQRVVTSADTARLCEILSSMSKRDVNEFVSLSVERADADTINVGAAFTADQSTLMSSLGITDITVKVVQFNVATGLWVPAGQMMTTSYFETGGSALPFDVQGVEPGSHSSNTENIECSPFIPAPNHNGHQIVVFVVMPIRTINNVKHILQEYCSFAAFEVPAGA